MVNLYRVSFVKYGYMDVQADTEAEAEELAEQALMVGDDYLVQSDDTWQMIDETVKVEGESVKPDILPFTINCPDCGTDDVDYGDYSFEEEVWQDATCNKCGCKYQMVYKPGYTEIQNPS